MHGHLLCLTTTEISETIGTVAGGRGRQLTMVASGIKRKQPNTPASSYTLRPGRRVFLMFVLALIDILVLHPLPIAAARICTLILVLPCSRPRPRHCLVLLTFLVYKIFGKSCCCPFYTQTTRHVLGLGCLVGHWVLAVLEAAGPRRGGKQKQNHQQQLQTSTISNYLNCYCCSWQ